MVGGGVLHVSVRVCVFVHVRACVTKPEGIVPGETEHVAAAFMLPPFVFFFFLFLLFSSSSFFFSFVTYRLHTGSPDYMLQGQAPKL